MKVSVHTFIKTLPHIQLILEDVQMILGLSLLQTDSALAGKLPVCMICFYGRPSLGLDLISSLSLQETGFRE